MNKFNKWLLKYHEKKMDKTDLYPVLYCYLALTIIMLISEIPIPCLLPRLRFCYALAFGGIVLKMVYYIIKIRKEDSFKKYRDSLNFFGSYIMYGFSLLALTSFIYVAYYDTFEDMELVYFRVTSFFIFLFLGFIVDSIKDLPSIFSVK